MKAKTILLILAVAVISAALTYALTGRRFQSAVAGPEPAAPKANVEIPGLKTEVAIAGEGWDTLSLTGKIAVPSDRLVQVSPRIDGKVVAAYPKVGDTVRKGQTLAMISSVDLAEARAQHRQALARLDAARQSLAQDMEIARLGANSARPLEDTRSAFLEAQGSLADAKSELAQAKTEVVKAESELAQCRARLDRAKELYADQLVSRQDLETAETEFKLDSASMESARSMVSQSESRVGNGKIAVEIAGRNLAREEKVYKGKIVDSRAIQSAKATVIAAETEVSAAADRIRVLGASPNGSGETLAVTSPISGRVTARHANVGEMASPSNALFTVADLSRVWVEADVYEKDLAKARRGQSAEIHVDAYPNRVFAGKVDSIGDILSSDSRTAKLRCVIDNSERLLKGEMFASVALITARRGSTVLIPKQAVLDDAGTKIVFTPCMECPEDKKAGTNACGAYDKLVVKLGSTHGNKVEALSGIEPGTRVVTVGAYQLKTALGSGQLKAGCADGH